MCDLDPHRHITEDLNNEKFSLHLIQCRVCPYGLSCFSAIRDANLLYTTVAVAPIPPAVVNTSGENEPCSISLIRSSYFLFFSISCLL